jgi:RHS repeat-associated protein
MTSRTFGNGTSQTLSWDGLGRLVSVIQRDSANNGYNWTATYDALGRRLRTTHTPVAANVAYPLQTLTIGSLYDPQVEFQELAVTLNPDLRYGPGAQRTWKVFGPDGDGRYGGMRGVGGLEATIRESDGQSTTVINDVFGNVVGTVSGTNGLWNPARVSSYGPEPGYQALTLSASVPLVETLVWRTRRIDPTGYYWLGARYYDPVGGRMLSPDPLGHAASMSLYDLCNGDPLNRFDADGRLGKGNYVAVDMENGYIQSFSAYDVAYLGLEAALRGETVDQGYARYLAPMTDRPIDSLDGQSFRMIFGDGASGAAEAAMMLDTGPLGLLAEVADASGAAGAASVTGTTSEKAFAYGRLALDLVTGALGAVPGIAGGPKVPEAAASGGGVWSLGPGPRGLAIEAQLGGNLPASFRVIDRFENGVATSIKSIDLNAATYQNAQALGSRLNSYVDRLAGFNGASRAGQVIDASQIAARQLQLAIPPGSASAAQQAVINAAATRAQGMGVNFIVTPFP